MLKELKRYPRYFINESGIIVDYNHNLIRYTADNEGKLYYYLNNNKEYMDRLVAETFLINSYNYDFINHKDKDIMNCHLSNLEWTDDYNKSDSYILENRNHRRYSNGGYIYQVYNEDESIVIDCIGRGKVADLIQYEEISLKNMVGNRRKISLGPYKGFMIRNTKVKI